MKKLGRDPQTEQKILLQEKRSRLQSDLDDFGRQARVFLNSLAISHSPQTSNIEEWSDLEDLDVDSDLPQSSTTATDISQMDESLPPELRPLPLPSASVYSTMQLHAMIHEGHIDLNPPYQRGPLY